MSDDIFKKVQSTFVEVLEVGAEDVTMETTIQTLDEWDSMRHLEIITKLEENLGVRFEMSEIIGLNSVAKIVEVTQKKKT